MDRFQSEEEIAVTFGSHEWPEEHLVEKAVTYTLEVDGRLFVIENVPARVNEETGEQFFSPQTVERLRQIIDGAGKPVRIIEAPVFDYAA
jgi:YgiT-type zinc finger domain-containing protein